MGPHPVAAPPVASALVDTVRATVARERLLARGERVLVAVSGGADSVALLHALVLLRGELALDLRVAHVHHGLRLEADRDAEFVLALAGRLGCPATVERVAVARAGRSPEEAARIARLAALERIARAASAGRVALGHTADDQAETVLMRALEGAGPRGLAGIPIRRGPFVRPLLDAGRAAVLQHLAVHDLPWVEDASNQDRRFLRNRIRHDLLPAIEAQGWPQLGGALRRTAGACREAVEALDTLLVPEVARSVHALPGGRLVDLAPLRALPPGAAKNLLRRAVLDLWTGGRPVSGLRAHHLTALHALVDGPVGASVRLPRGLTVERARHGLWIAPLTPPSSAVPVAVPGETRLDAPGLRLAVDLVSAAAAPAQPTGSPWEAWFDQETAPMPLALRPACRDDRVVPLGADGPVRVSRVLAAAGYPRRARRHWPLVVAMRPGGEEVLWVVGVRRASQAPVTPETRTVLRIRAVAYPEALGTREESS
jgi:tRNA(Ile)-lysidine synthase